MKLKIFFKKWLSRSGKPDYDGIQYVESLVDVPKNTGTVIFIVTDGNRNKWVVFQCPDKCGRRVEVNLMQKRYPFWVAKIKKKKVSLQPSVVVQGCGTHFWLNDNKVVEAKFSNED